jgi:hypothetical protein
MAEQQTDPREEQATLAYNTYRQACAFRNEAGLPMPEWQHLSVPLREAWLQVSGAVTGTQAPEGTSAASQTTPQAPPDPLEALTPKPTPAGPETPSMPDPSMTSPQPMTQESLDALTVQDLRTRGQEAGLQVSSSASKQELIDMLLEHQRTQSTPQVSPPPPPEQPPPAPED